MVKEAPGMKKYLKYVILAALVIVALVAYTQIRKQKNRPEWRTENPSRGVVREVVTATGSLNPYVLVEVGTEVSGEIAKIYKDFNDRVRKGELLAKLDTELLTTSLESARADVNKATISRDEAKLEYDIRKELFDKNMSSEYEMKKAEYAYKQAQQSLANAQLKLQTAQKNLQNASITSPIDGVIVARNVNEGQTVAASFSAPTLFTIANNLDQMQITANVDEADIGKIKVGLPVEFTVDAYAGEQFAGSVQQIRLNPTTEQNVVSYSVIIDAANPRQKLLPGMTTNVTIIVQSKENVLRIPETATRFAPSKEIWESFGLKWEEDLIANARKTAMEEAMNKAKSLAAKSSQEPEQNSAAASDSQRKARTAPPAGSGRQRPFSGAGPGTRPTQFGGGAMPNGAGNGRSGMAMIWVLKDKNPQLIMVRTGVSDGSAVEVLSELDPGIQIITGVNYKDAAQTKKNSAIGGPGMGPRF